MSGCMRSCRSPDIDLFYANELKDLNQDGGAPYDRKQLLIMDRTSFPVPSDLLKRQPCPL